MINWKIYTMRHYIDENGKLCPILTMTHEEETQDADSREEAFDDFDAYCGLEKLRLTEQGMAITLTLTEYEKPDDIDGKTLAIVHIVRGYRESMDKETGEVTFIRDKDDSISSPVYTRYEQYWGLE